MTLTPQLAQQCLEALEPFTKRNSSEPTITVPVWSADVTRARATVSALREALESPPTPILERAVALHEKAGMPWPDAEELALNEAGIDVKAIDELIGECASMGLESLLATPDDLRAFTRSVLVHQPPGALASGEGDEARDAARLDWMIFHSARVKHASDAEYCFVEWSDEDWKTTTKPFGNAREAIDAAMKGNGK